MCLSILENDYVKIVIVLFLSIAFLVLFAYFASLATKFANRNKYRKMDDKNKDSRQAKLYELIYSKDGIKLEELNDYFNCDLKILEEDLKEMCNNNIVKFENEKYIINR